MVIIAVHKNTGKNTAIVDAIKWKQNVTRQIK